ncbi:acyl carrier protein, partial [Streptomyces sp. RK62]
MREVNENGPAPADQRATAEAIERGGIGLSVTDLLARVAPGAAPQPEAPAAPEPSAAPRDEAALVAEVAALAGRYVPAGHLAPDADFFDAGGTSVHAVELVAALETELGLTVDLDEVFADARPASLVRRAIRANGAETAGQRDTAGLRVVQRETAGLTVVQRPTTGLVTTEPAPHPAHPAPT